MLPTAVMNSPEWHDERKKSELEQRFGQQALEGRKGVQPLEDPHDAIGQTVETWLTQNYPPVSSETTATIYRKLLNSLRTYLGLQGLDLDSPDQQLARQIQTWANQRTPNSKRQGDVAPSTYNQRIAAINSFYTWVKQCGIHDWANPTEQLDRTTVRKYSDASALDVQQVSKQLKEIDRGTPRGQRDYTLLQVALNTGRSARELASLTLGSLDLQGEHVTLTFANGRGGKVMCDTLDVRLSQMLLRYLQTIYGANLATLNSQAPIWISFSDRTYRQAIGQQTIADICEAHLGVSRVHRLRHTFAFAMDQLGASTGVIQTRLGHESRSTTDIYLASLKRAQNPYATVLADAFGVEQE